MAPLSAARWVFFISGALMTLAAAVVAHAAAVHGEASVVAKTWVGGVTLASAILLGTAGLAFPRAARSGRLLATLGTLAAIVVAAPFLRRSPGLSLLLVLTLLTGLLLVGDGNPPGMAALPAALRRAWRARGAATASTLASLFGAAAQRSLVLLEAAALALGSVIAIAFVAKWAAAKDVARTTRVLLGAAGAVTVIGLMASLGNPRGAVGWLALVPAISLFVVPLERAPGEEQFDWWELLIAHPPRLLVATFLGLSFVGTFLLALPLASATGTSVGYLDAMFTAVSAVCVTGLIVLDTPSAFSDFGLVVIAFLIQLGGLGIMTFSTAAFGLLGRRLGLAHETAIAGLVSVRDRSEIFTAVKRVLLVTAAAETGGAVMLTGAFWAHGDSLGRALGRGVFTAISAFCNAGFALQTDSLVPYQHSGTVLLTVAVLIVAGGVSPLVIVLVPKVLTRGHTRAQEKLVVLVTAILLAGGTLFFALLEWNGSLARLPFWDRILNAWFQSATLRTAGFNSVDMATLAPSTVALMMLWMFIGGSPGGTAGGVKTTTAAVLVLAVAAAVRGGSDALAFKRRIPHDTVYRAAAVATVGVALVVGGYLALVLTQKIPSGVALFEIVSALATVGLSVGGTAMLDEVGKVIIAASMLMGRVGPLTFFMFLSRSAPHKRSRRPEEEIETG